MFTFKVQSLKLDSAWRTDREAGSRSKRSYFSETCKLPSEQCNKCWTAKELMIQKPLGVEANISESLIGRAKEPLGFDRCVHDSPGRYNR